VRASFLVRGSGLGERDCEREAGERVRDREGDREAERLRPRGLLRGPRGGDHRLFPAHGLRGGGDRLHPPYLGGDLRRPNPKPPLRGGTSLLCQGLGERRLGKVYWTVTVLPSICA